MYSKHIEVRYFPGTGEAVLIIDGVADNTYRSIPEALKAASAEFTREVIRRARINDDSDASR
jgi:hypothetical protein